MMTDKIYIKILLTWATLIYSNVHHVRALADGDVRVMAFAFMNISTDDPGLAQFHSIHLGSIMEAKLRFEFPHQNEDNYIELNDDTTKFIQRTWAADLSESHLAIVNDHSFRVVSEVKVDIYGIKAVQGSTDGFRVIPLTSTSTEFFIMSFKESPQGHSSFMVVSSYPDTCVEASYIRDGKLVRLFFVALKEFEAYQQYSQNEDYTGVYINASRPVSVFSGHECAQVPLNMVFCDHLIEQMPPVREWGRESIVGPIIGRNYRAGYIIRVLGARDNMNLKIYDEANNEVASGTRDRGFFFEYDNDDARKSLRVVCEANCLVVQYNKGFFAATGDNSDVPSDPFMTVIVPVDHYTNDMTLSTAEYWYRDGNNGRGEVKPFTSYLTIVAKSDAETTSGIRLNGQPIESSWTKVTGSDYSVTALSLAHGNYTLAHASGTVKFIGYVYGHSLNEPTGYGYPTGYSLRGSKIPGTFFTNILSNANVPQTPKTCKQKRGAPAQKDRGPDLLLRAQVVFKSEAVTADCANKYKIILNGKLPSIENLINELLCVDTLCKDTTSAFFSNLRISKYLPEESGDKATHFVLEADLVTSLDETTSGIILCKRQLLAFLRNPYNWNMPIDVPNCPAVDFDATNFDVVFDQYKCPANFN